ncbi:MAG: hypothetical protein AB1646_02145 [Thermodesulfobacteriota bacterium]
MSRRLDVDLFVEDSAHEHFLRGLVLRLSEDEAKCIAVHVRCATGGHGRVLKELKTWLKLFERGAVPAPELIVAALDANCSQFHSKRREILDTVPPELRSRVVAACPDPHVERWYMADEASFHRVVGSAPSIKKEKCERDYYKNALAHAVRMAGHPPALGGVEFARELAEQIDLYRASKADASLGAFLDDFRAALRRS